jgi:hypothetical protein
MRGRKPRKVAVAAGDAAVLEFIAASQQLPAYQVMRARIVLAIARGERTTQLAQTMDCDEATIWRICRRYEEGGLSGLLEDARRTSRSFGCDPPAAQPAQA